MSEIKKGKLLYEGKAKRLYATENPDELIMEFKDDLTAFDATKKGSMADKGIVNNKISSLIMGALDRMGIENTLIKVLDDTHCLVKNVEIVQTEVIVRYEAQGSFCKRYGITPGLPINPPLCEIGYKCDELHDPFFTDDIAAFMGIATRDELAKIRYMAITVGEKLREIYGAAGIRLIDFKLEFGRYRPKDGEERIILADEVTPDTCRLVDSETGEKLDKDLFRFDMGDVSEGYKKLLKKLEA